MRGATYVAMEGTAFGVVPATVGRLVAEKQETGTLG